MMAPDRISCLNPNCRRTAPRNDPADADAKIVCGKCWRLLPPELRAEWKRFVFQERRMRRRVERRIAQRSIGRETVEHIGRRLCARHDRIWQQIERYFTAPAQPIGLDGFLKEVGL